VIPPQDPERAALELRRAAQQLGYRAAVVRTTGLRLPLGHKFYDPIYREAESMNCAIAVHGTNGAEALEAGEVDAARERGERLGFSTSTLVAGSARRTGCRTCR
jgi:predicted TIM-barrel fold metal-dependent hydrolase